MKRTIRVVALCVTASVTTVLFLNVFGAIELTDRQSAALALVACAAVAASTFASGVVRAIRSL